VEVNLAPKLQDGVLNTGNSSVVYRRLLTLIWKNTDGWKKNSADIRISRIIA